MMKLKSVISKNMDGSNSPARNAKVYYRRSTFVTDINSLVQSLECILVSDKGGFFEIFLLQTMEITKPDFISGLIHKHISLALLS